MSTKNIKNPIPAKMMELLKIEPDFNETNYICDLAMKSNDIDYIKTILGNVKMRLNFAIIRSYVAKFMEQEKGDLEGFKKYNKEFTDNCNACIDEFMKDDPDYQEFIKKKEKGHKAKIIKFKKSKK